MFTSILQFRTFPNHGNLLLITTTSSTGYGFVSSSLPIVLLIYLVYNTFMHHDYVNFQYYPHFVVVVTLCLVSFYDCYSGLKQIIKSLDMRDMLGLGLTTASFLVDINFISLRTIASRLNINSWKTRRQLRGFEIIFVSVEYRLHLK